MRVQSNLVDTVIKAYHNGVLAADSEDTEPKQAPTLTPAEVNAEVDRSFWADLVEGGASYEGVPA